MTPYRWLLLVVLVYALLAVLGAAGRYRIVFLVVSVLVAAYLAGWYRW